MPHLRFRGMKIKELQDVSKDMLDQLVILMDLPRDHFTMEYVASTFIFDGEIDGNEYPFVTVDWFDRGDKVRAEVANIITDMLKQFDYEDIAVYFNDLEKGHYFENGEHF